MDILPPLDAGLVRRLHIDYLNQLPKGMRTKRRKCPNGNLTIIRNMRQRAEGAYIFGRNQRAGNQYVLRRDQWSRCRKYFGKQTQKRNPRKYLLSTPSSKSTDNTTKTCLFILKSSSVIYSRICHSSPIATLFNNLLPAFPSLDFSFIRG